MQSKIVHLWNRLDWRIAAILIGALTAVALTASCYLAGIGREPSTHFGAIFASWVSGVALFCVAGVTVAIVSLARPEESTFDSRARILFRGQTGKHIDYIVAKMKEVFEHYAESYKIKIAIEKYHEEEKKLLLSVQDEVVLRSFLSDIVSTWTSRINHYEVASAPVGEDRNRVIFVRINGKPAANATDFDDKIVIPISSSIERNTSCKLEYLLRYWSREESEFHSHETIRYTQGISVDFENRSGSDIIVQYVDHNCAGIEEEKWESFMQKDGNEITLRPGETKRVIELRDVPPDTLAYIYRLRGS